MLRGRGAVRASTLALTTLLVLSAGCVRKDVAGRETVYRYEPVCSIAVLAGAGAISLLCLYAFRKLADKPGPQVWAFMGMIAPPILALACVGTMVKDQVRVDDDGFAIVEGSLFQTKTRSFRFDQFAQIVLMNETSTKTSRMGLKRKSETELLDFIRKNGTSEKLYPGELIGEAASDLLARAAARGVALVHIEGDSLSYQALKQRTDMSASIRGRYLRHRTRIEPKTKGTSSRTAKGRPKSAPPGEPIDANLTEKVRKSDVPVAEDRRSPSP